MPQTIDTLDITLLRTNKNEFILQCQRIIKIVVRHYIKSGMFTYDQYQDITQSAIEELIKRLPNIEKTFDDSVLMITYMNVVIRNICLRIHERNHATITTVPLSNELTLFKENELNSLYIQDEIERLKRILRMYGTLQLKITICLKIYFTVPVTNEELQRCFSKSSATEKAFLFERFGKNNNRSLDSDNFNVLATIMNKQENNSTSGNSLRRWTKEHLTKIITLLNGTPPTRSHTKETIKTLFEHY